MTTFCVATCLSLVSYALRRRQRRLPDCFFHCGVQLHLYWRRGVVTPRSLLGDYNSSCDSVNVRPGGSSANGGGALTPLSGGGPPRTSTVGSRNTTAAIVGGGVAVAAAAAGLPKEQEVGGRRLRLIEHGYMGRKRSNVERTPSRRTSTADW